MAGLGRAKGPGIDAAVERTLSFIADLAVNLPQMFAVAEVHDGTDSISGSWMSARQVGGQIGDPGPPVPSPPPGDTT